MYHPKSNMSQLSRALIYRGLPTRVARKCGVTLSFVCRVIKGSSSSARVRRAVLQEVARVEKSLNRGEKAA